MQIAKSVGVFHGNLGSKLPAAFAGTNLLAP
jgi:hypothetical protein